MTWQVRELQSPQVLNSDLTESEKELIKLFLNSAIQERVNYRGKGRYFDGIQTGIAQTLRMLNREDIWDLIDYEFPYHDELN